MVGRERADNKLCCLLIGQDLEYVRRGRDEYVLEKVEGASDK